MMNRITTAVRNRAAFIRTRREIAAMPLDVALDLDIHRADADAIARRAVWG